MRIITLQQIKDNSRIESTVEDAVLEQIGDAAEEMVMNLMDRTYEDVLAEFGEIPAPIVRACLALAEHLYNHRGIVSQQSLSAIPYTIDAMIKSYIRY